MDDSKSSVEASLTRLKQLLPLFDKVKHQEAEISDLKRVIHGLEEQVETLQKQLLQSDGTLEELTLDGIGDYQQQQQKQQQQQQRKKGLAGSPLRRLASDRPRSSSDDGTFFSTYSKLSRVQSYRGDFNEESIGTNNDDETNNSSPSPTKDLLGCHEGNTEHAYEEGIETLRNHAIIEKLQVKGRCGYRLLTCNDQKCFIQPVLSGLIHIPHLTKMLVKFKWIHRPNMVFMVKKPREPDASKLLVQMATHLTNHGLQVVVEDSVFQHDDDSTIKALQDLNVLGIDRDGVPELPIDFCVCIGGDGTIIWTANLFPQGVPPVVSIAMGSLGFLSTFPVSESATIIDKVLNEDVVLTLRSRLEAHLKKASTGEVIVRSVLNEVVIDRGPTNTIVNLDLFIGSNKREPITHVQGDGLIISTPTGSTAYSLSAGGSMVHPSIPCVVVTPICPHSLSFRPIVVSDTTGIKIQMFPGARANAFVSFDGSEHVELEKGDVLSIMVSEFPVPCVCHEDESMDWFGAIKRSFNWNERKVQKPMPNL